MMRAWVFPPRSRNCSPARPVVRAWPATAVSPAASIIRTIGGIPWLMPEPRLRPERMARSPASPADALCVRIRSDSAQRSRDCRPPALRAGASSMSRARSTTRPSRIRALMLPLGVERRNEAHAVHVALGTELPLNQGLSTYYPNLHRDWCWGDAENRASLAAVQASLPAGARAAAHPGHRRGRRPARLRPAPGAPPDPDGRAATSIRCSCSPPRGSWRARRSSCTSSRSRRAASRTTRVLRRHAGPGTAGAGTCARARRCERAALPRRAASTPC